jgi:hypothetical protein
VLLKIVEVDVDVFGRAAYGAHGVAVVAVVEEHVGILVEAFELFGRAAAFAVVVLGVANGEVLVTAADDGAKGDCGNDCCVLVPAWAWPMHVQAYHLHQAQ